MLTLEPLTVKTHRDKAGGGHRAPTTLMTELHLRWAEGRAGGPCWCRFSFLSLASWGFLVSLQISCRD